MKQPFRMTHQRDIIIKELSKSKNYPTPDDLFQRVKKRLPSISLATVYRNLNILSDAGLIQRIEIKGHKKRYSLDTEPHDFIICTSCKQIENIELDQKQKQALISGHDKGYQIADCRVEVSGVCPKCQEKNI